MSDLIKRLRESYNNWDSGYKADGALLGEAADALESANARIVDLLIQLEQKELARKTLAMGYEHASKRAAELEADADRYRWLRFKHQNIHMTWHLPSGEALDSAIDNAMNAQVEHDAQ